MLILSCLFGIFSSVAGLYLSYHLNFASGASIVLVSVFIFSIAFLFSPKEGIVIKGLRRRKNSINHLIEDIIKQMNKNTEVMNTSQLTNTLSEKLGIPGNKIQNTLGKIKKMKLIEISNGGYDLTEKGKKVAERIVRSHRLWETYITEKNIVNIEDIHQDAEKYEHILSDDLLAELDEELGHPEKDPHGSPIPKNIQK